MGGSILRSPLAVAGLIFGIALAAVLASIFPMVNSIHAEERAIGVTAGTALPGAVDHTHRRYPYKLKQSHYQRHATRDSCTVPYSYTVNGQTYSTTDSVGGTCEQAKLEEGLKVYYDPKDPSQADLHNPAGPSYFILTLIVIADVLILGMAGLVSGSILRRYLQSKRSYEGFESY